MLGRYEAGSLRVNPLMKSVKRNKRVMAKSGPLYVENVGSGKSKNPLNKCMLPFLGTACIPQSTCNLIIKFIYISNFFRKNFF